MSVSKKVSNKVAGAAPKTKADTKPKAKAAATEESKVRNRKPAAAEQITRNLDGVESEGTRGALENPPEDIAPKNDSPQVKASTAARARAAELGIDLSQVKGTGKGGIINKTDVENFSKKDVENFLDETAPVPGTMGVLQKSQVETGPDYGAIGGLSDEDLAGQYLTALVDAANSGTSTDMIRALSEFSRQQPTGIRGPQPAMDMSRLGEVATFRPDPVNGDFAGLSAADFPGPAPTPGDVPRGNPDGVLDPSRMASPQFQYKSPATIASALDMSGLRGAAFPPPGGRTMDMSGLTDKDFPPPAPVPGDPAMPPSSGAMNMNSLAGAMPPSALSPAPSPDAPTLIPTPTPQPSPWMQMGKSEVPAAEPVSNADTFLKSRGLGGMLADAGRTAWNYAKEHPYRTAFGGLAALGGGSLVAANLNAGGGGKFGPPTEEEMQELARRRDEAWNAAAGGQKVAPSAPAR